MKRYFITIYDRNTNSVQYFERTQETIDSLVEKELGSWTTHSACTSGVKPNKDEFFQTGTTKDNSKCFSILCVVTEVKEEIKDRKIHRIGGLNATYGNGIFLTDKKERLRIYIKDFKEYLEKYDFNDNPVIDLSNEKYEITLSINKKYGR